jgi:Ca2+:H+ antiporter
LEKYDADIVQLVAVTAEFLVDSIDGLTESGKIKKEFVGIILLPIVGNAAGTQISSHT